MADTGLKESDFESDGRRGPDIRETVEVYDRGGGDERRGEFLIAIEVDVVDAHFAGNSVRRYSFNAQHKLIATTQKEYCGDPPASAYR